MTPNEQAQAERLSADIADERNRVIVALRAEVKTLKEQLAEAQKDADRYRWLKTRPVDCPIIGPDLALWDEESGDALRGDEADAAIDAAVAAQEVKS